jgi:hypothetical protein
VEPQQHHEPGRALDEGAYRRSVQPEDEVALPVAGDSSIVCLGGPFADHDLRRHELLSSPASAGSGHAQRKTGSSQRKTGSPRAPKPEGPGGPREPAAGRGAYGAARSGSLPAPRERSNQNHALRGEPDERQCLYERTEQALRDRENEIPPPDDGEYQLALDFDLEVDQFCQWLPPDESKIDVRRLTADQRESITTLCRQVWGWLNRTAGPKPPFFLEDAWERIQPRSEAEPLEPSPTTNGASARSDCSCSRLPITATDGATGTCVFLPQQTTGGFTMTHPSTREGPDESMNVGPRDGR